MLWPLSGTKSTFDHVQNGVKILKTNVHNRPLVFSIFGHFPDRKLKDSKNSSSAIVKSINHVQASCHLLVHVADNVRPYIA
jgi:hypothetical protein